MQREARGEGNSNRDIVSEKRGLVTDEEGDVYTSVF